MRSSLNRFSSLIAVIVFAVFVGGNAMGAYNPGGSSGGGFSGAVNQVAYGGASSGELEGSAGFTHALVGASDYVVSLDGAAMVPARDPTFRLAKSDGVTNIEITGDSLTINNSDTVVLDAGGLNVGSALTAETVVTPATIALNDMSNLLFAAITPSVVSVEDIANSRHALLAVSSASGDSLLSLSDGSDLVQIHGAVAAGTASATFNATNKPGPTSVLEPFTWLSVKINGGQFWLPLFFD